MPDASSQPKGPQETESQERPYPMLAPLDDGREFCNFLGVNGSGDTERCIREKGHEGEHVGMGSD